MLSQQTSRRKTLINIDNFLKWLELIIFGACLAIFVWFTFNLFRCQEFCSPANVNTNFAILLIRLSFILGGLIYTTRIIAIYLIFDDNPQSETGFYISMAAIASSFVLYGIFINQIQLKPAINNFSSILTFILTGLFLIASTSLLADKQSWHQSNSFVRARISLSLFFLALLLVSPTLGLMSALVFIPLFLLIRTPKINKKLSK
ncbi:hypothetical protein HC766_05265 [Candidatus Gracilibacteria bacterium]|nr:hypothetical protein [Candidatus Gracilibacteria bacterium]NJS41720.1 hypothetical protein [Candidatus Gracilibacteria bacterium]